MKDPIFLRRDDRLSSVQVRYWRDLLYRTLKIGAELEFALPKGTAKDSVLRQLETALEPSGDMARLGRYGVLDVQTEHCGLEVRIIGRQPYYPAILEQYREIIAALPRGVRARPTCGLHFHLLTVGLAEPLPEIILANLWNLVRRYAAALRFMTSAGASRAALCRRRNHTSHLEMVRLSPGFRTMSDIASHLHASEVVPEHQNFFNLEHVRFTPTGAIEKLHIELRFPDADLAPTSIAAKTMLFLAMVLKAVDLSHYGLIHVGDVVRWKRTLALLNALSNNDGDLATSDTTKITDDAMDELRAWGLELVQLLKPVLAWMDQEEVYAILRFLAETPLSLLRCDGLSWHEIEEMLSSSQKHDTGEGKPLDERRLGQCIELIEISGCSSLKEWTQRAGEHLILPVSEIERLMKCLGRWRSTRWDGELGAVVFQD